MGYAFHPSKETKSHCNVLIVKHLAPDYMQNMFVPCSSNYTLRNSIGLVNLPMPHTDFLKRSFSYSGAYLWNSLPKNVRKITYLTQFKMEVDGIFLNI